MNNQKGRAALGLPSLRRIYSISENFISRLHGNLDLVSVDALVQLDRE